MALRVLLADESVTIKKVIQLALQDFAVEVKAVPVGLDVLEVSKSFQPDLVFADILLQKRSGYEVCGDLKKDPATAAIPVILMWSSFMELDQRQVDACGADGRLEKPFEVEALRKLVLELVPRTRSQRLAHFLEYPPSLAAPLRDEARSAASRATASPPSRPAPSMAQPPSAQSAQHMTPPAPASAGAFGGGLASHVSPATPPPAKPKMPPPLGGAAGNPFGGPSGGAAATAKSPATNPFGTSFDAPRPAIPKPQTPDLSALTPPPSIPDRVMERPAKPMAPPPPAQSLPYAPSAPAARFEEPAPTATNSLPPLGALPDLQLEGSSPSPGTAQSSGWNMESFEALDLGPLNLDDDDDAKESFQPLQLPQAQPNPSPLAAASTLGASLSLTTDDDEDDADADKWSNRSLDKYRLPPLKPDESLAVDERNPDFAAAPVTSDFTASTTARIPQPTFTPAAPVRAEKELVAPTDVPQFSLSEDDYDRTSRLEVEHVAQPEHTRPSIVRELLRDPEFSYDDKTVRQKTVARHDRTNAGDAAVDLSSAGRPASTGFSAGDNAQLEEMVRNQVAPQLEKVIEKIVAQLLPQIAERIIKRELERLLEES